MEFSGSSDTNNQIDDTNGPVENTDDEMYIEFSGSSDANSNKNTFADIPHQVLQR